MHFHMFTVATRVTVWNGHTRRFLMSNWTQGAPLASMFLDLFEHSKRKNRTLAEEMVNETWIWDLTHGITPDLLAKYVTLWIMVDATGLSI
jgi:hypothetical protein